MQNFNITEFFKDLRQICVLLFVAATIYGLFDDGDLRVASLVALLSIGVIFITNLKRKND